MQRAYRLRRGTDFDRVRASRRSWAHPLLICYASPADGIGLPRIGIAVGRHVGNAVVRNQVKRRIREAVRSFYGKIQPGVDLVLIARPAASKAAYADLARAVDSLIERTARQGVGPTGHVGGPQQS